MNVQVDLCVIPIGIGISIAPYGAVCQKVLDEANLSFTLHACGTNIEGDWNDVFAALRRCHEVIHNMKAPRISTTIKMGTRTDRRQRLQDKVDAVLRLGDAT